MKIGIIGHGKDKFSQIGYARATWLIDEIIDTHPNCTIVSGHSPVGGIDIWAEELAKLKGIGLDLKIPKQHTWDAEYGYKQRNLDIAKDSDEIHIILVDKYPKRYTGMTFGKCYHCNTNKHIKSGACWTGKQAQKLGKKVIWHIIKND
jgi:hypothetical protein